jgi:hypothetical protein
MELRITRKSIAHKRVLSGELDPWGEPKYDIPILDPLPAGLRALFCNDIQLSALPELPESLEILDCGRNFLKELPKLPAGLKQLHCWANSLKILPELPDGLEYLVCFQNKLENLPKLPDSLLILTCGDNKLQSLPELPASLMKLHCNENQLLELPTLPPNLQDLSCVKNKLTLLPLLPQELQALQAHMNPYPAPLLDLFREMGRYSLVHGLSLYKSRINEFLEKEYSLRNLRKKGRNLHMVANVGKSHSRNIPNNIVGRIGYALTGQKPTGTMNKTRQNVKNQYMKQTGRGTRKYRI